MIHPELKATIDAEIAKGYDAYHVMTGWASAKLWIIGNVSDNPGEVARAASQEFDEASRYASSERNAYLSREEARVFGHATPTPEPENWRMTPDMERAG